MPGMGIQCRLPVCSQHTCTLVYIQQLRPSAGINRPKKTHQMRPKKGSYQTLRHPSRGKNYLFCSIKRIKRHFVLQVALVRQEDRPMDKPSPKIKGQMNRTLGIQQGWRSLAASDPRALQAFSSQQSQDWTPHHASCRWPPVRYQGPSGLSAEKRSLNTVPLTNTLPHLVP